MSITRTTIICHLIFFQNPWNWIKANLNWNWHLKIRRTLQNNLCVIIESVHVWRASFASTKREHDLKLMQIIITTTKTEVFCPDLEVQDLVHGLLHFVCLLPFSSKHFDISYSYHTRYIKVKVEHYLLFSPPKISWVVSGINYICLHLLPVFYLIQPSSK